MTAKTKSPAAPLKFPESQTVAVLSTAHLTIRDADLLEAVVDGLSNPHIPVAVISDTSHGYWIYVDGEDDPKLLCDVGFSSAFADLLAAAKKEGFTWLRLDCDGVVSPAFPTFEWPVIRDDMVDRVAKQFKAIFSAQINSDSHALECFVNGLKFGLIGKRGVHAAELIRAAEKLGFKMSRKATYDYLFNRPVDLADNEFVFVDEVGNPQWQST